MYRGICATHKAVLMMLLAVISSCAAYREIPNTAAWFKIGVNSDIGTTFYVDPTSIRKSGDKAKMWSLYNYSSVRDTLGVWSLSSIALNEYDCKEDRVIIRFLSVHSGNMGEGEVALISMNIDASEIHVPSGSISKISLRLACGKG